VATKKTSKPKAKKRVLKAARLRLMPLTMAMLSLLLVAKLNDLYIGSRELHDVLAVRNASAADETKPAEEAKPAETAKPAEGDAATPEAEANAPADAAGAEVKPADAAAPKSEEGHGEAAAKPEKEPTTYGEGKLTLKEVEALKAKESQEPYTQNELDLLQNLTKRREELDQRSKDLDMKANVLDATEKRINDKVGEMKSLQAELSKVVEAYKTQQNTEIMSLVKVYENMKPGDAANIFNELDMPILLEIIDKMSERKVAPVLAAMDPKHARDVTQELAELRKNRKNVSDAANNAVK
jgi:flagellar motility protein MotE (MotC chaperone)